MYLPDFCGQNTGQSINATFAFVGNGLVSLVEEEANELWSHGYLHGFMYFEPTGQSASFS